MVVRTTNSIEDRLNIKKWSKAAERKKKLTWCIDPSFDNLLHIINDPDYADALHHQTRRGHAPLNRQDCRHQHFVSVALNVTFEIDEIFSFFTSHWMAIGGVINDVAGTVKYFLEEGSRRVRV